MLWAPRPRWRLLDLLAAAGLYGAATLVLTYPLALHPRATGRFENGDARLNAWAISWVSHQVETDPLRLFEANIFYPLPHTLAFSEHLFVPGLLALPLLRATDDLVFASNGVLLLSIFLSALGMYFLVRALTESHGAALVSGLFFSFAPYRFDQLPHLQMQLYAFLPLALVMLHRFFLTGSTPSALGFSLFFALQALSGTYLAAISAVAVGVAIAVLGPASRLGRRAWLKLAVAALLAAAAIYPFARPYLWVHETLGVEWDLPGIGSLSASPSSYVSSSSRLYRGFMAGSPALFPGITLLALGCGGAVRLFFGRHHSRSVALCYVAILVAGVLISLGPATPVQPFLYEHVVFFRGLRALWRFGLLPLLSLSVLSGHALSWILDHSRRRVTVAVGAFFVAESTGLPYPVEPFRDDPPPVYRWLATEAKPGPVLELPFRVIDTRYMFWARHHRFRPTLNGDSGFIPASHLWMQVLFRRFPSEDSVALLQALDVRYVIVHLGAYRESALVRLLNGLDAHREVLVPVRDFGRDLVFEVVPPRAKPPGILLLDPRLAVTAEPAALFDGNLTAPWVAPSEVLEIEARLHGRNRVSGLRLHYGSSPRMPVARVEIEVGDASGAWRKKWSSPPAWPAVAQVVLGLLRDPPRALQELAFDPLETDRVRLRLHGLEGPPELTELEIMGATVDPR